jgi:hypothetical protein
MTAPDLETEIFVSLHQLPVEQQRHVLEFVRAFGTARVQGGGQDRRCCTSLVRSTSATWRSFMTQAIEDGCEQIHDAKMAIALTSRQRTIP